MSTFPIVGSGPRPHWVGPSVTAPQNERGRSPSGRQRHYKAVELAGAGQQVYVNDVVMIAKSDQSGISEHRPRLVQVGSVGPRPLVFVLCVQSYFNHACLAWPR